MRAPRSILCMHSAFTTLHHQANAFTCLFVKFDSPAFPVRAYSEVWDHRYRILASDHEFCACASLRTWYVSGLFPAVGPVHLPNSSLTSYSSITCLNTYSTLPVPSKPTNQINLISNLSTNTTNPHSQPPPCTASPPPLLAPPAPPTPASSPLYVQPTPFKKHPQHNQCHPQCIKNLPN